MVDILTCAHVLLGCVWPRRQPNNTSKVYASILCNNKLALKKILFVAVELEKSCARPWQDLNLQSPVSETDALSIRPQGHC